LLARATEEPSEREAALRKAAALWAESAIAQAALASHLASTGRGREALPFANAAVELAPWNPDVVAALAQVALELGKCPEAVVLQTRAVEITDAGGVGSVASDAAALRRQLTDYRARCNAGQAGTTASGKASD
jgi:predicted Zn-dependent protease